MKKYINILISFVLLLSFAGCKDYMDINYDPNSPSQENLTSDIMLPAVEMNIAATYSYNLHILGAYNVQYYAQQFGTPNYVEYSKFNVSATNGSGIYTQLYQRALGNLQEVLSMAADNKEPGVILQATVLRAYAYQLLVDAFGEVPYTEAFDVNNLAPKYDEGQAIYEGLIAELDKALANVTSSDYVATSFIFPDKNINDWIQFANALKLKMLTRMSGVKDVSAQIKAIIDDDNLPTADIAIAGCWANSAGQANPFFQEEASEWARVKGNVIANLAIVSTMKQDAYTDPRLAALFSANGNDEYQGSISGTNLSTVEDKYASTSAWCSPVIDYNTPVILIALSEVKFFLAEYYARTGDAASAATAYSEAVDASFASLGVSGSDACVAQFPYDQSKWQEVIGIAKWVALAGVNGFEGYTEARRLDFPAFGTIKGSDIFKADGTLDLTLYTPATLYTPYQRFDQVGDNHLLERFPYPESSTSRNNNSPQFPGYTTPIFWGK